VRPAYPAQVPVSYYQAGRICEYIAEKWGYDKLLAMIQAFAQRMSTKDAIQQVLGVAPAELDRQFLAWLEAETKTTVAGFEEWKKRIRALNEAAQAGRHDAVMRDGPAVRDLYPEYVEAGSAYELLAEAHLAQGNKAGAAAELGRYAAIGGREPALIKKLAALLEELGRAKEAAQAWQRLNWVYPHDEELHRRLGELMLAQGDAAGAIRELKVVIALKPQDPAAAHFNLARAYRQADRVEDAKEQVLLALEAAPGYRPAQKMLLELAGAGISSGGRAK
jgi:tetratricopeptide (TPR) repeat protein